MLLHVVDHTHWDREWHKTYQEFRVKLIYFIDELMDVLYTNDSYGSFLLDGQTSLLDDYLEVKPENEERLRYLITKGKLKIGPWYVQPDTFIPSGEALIRNLLVSRLLGDRFGEWMHAGYLPDSFGFSAHIPQLLNGFNIDTAFMYRGLSRADIKHTEFRWKGADQSEVIATALDLGYGNAMYLSGDVKNDIAEIEKNLTAFKSIAAGNNILLLCGADQDRIRHNLPEIIEQLNAYYKDRKIELVMSSLPEYSNKVKDEARNLETYMGEMRKPEFGRVHLSITSTRLDIKKENFQTQNLYEKYIEPITTAAYLCGASYENSIINRGWKYQIENQAHDSICSVCTDQIHRDILMRYRWSQQTGNTVLHDSIRYLFDSISFKEHMGKPLIVFNSTAQARTEIVEALVYVAKKTFEIMDSDGTSIPYQIIESETVNLADTGVDVFVKTEDRLYHKIRVVFPVTFRGYGYKTFYINEEKNTKIDKRSTEVLLGKDWGLENEYLELEFNKDGSFNVKLKGQEIRYNSLHLFEESGNAGDEYDYSPPKNDIIIRSEDSTASWEIFENGPIRATALVTIQLTCPINTNSKSRSEDYTTCAVFSYVTLSQKADRIEIKTIIDNQVEDHRIRVLFDPKIRASTHLADGQFGPIERKNSFPETENWEGMGWKEKYYPIFPQQAYVNISNRTEGLAIFNRGLPQYEIIGGEKPVVALTLLSGVSHLGKRDLINRPGRKSGVHIPTPEAQLKGTFTAEYAIKPYTGTFNEATAPQSAYSYITPLYALTRESIEEYISPLKQEKRYENTVPEFQELFRVLDGEVVTSAIKKTERETGIIWRIYNPLTIAQKKVRLGFDSTYFHSVTLVDFNEHQRFSDRLSVREDSVVLDHLYCNEVISLKFNLTADE